MLLLGVLGGVVVASATAAWGLTPLSDEAMRATVGAAQGTYHFSYCAGPKGCGTAPGCLDKNVYGCYRDPKVPEHCQRQFFDGEWGECKFAIRMVCDWEDWECWKRKWGLDDEETGCAAGCPIYQYGECRVIKCETWQPPY